MWIKLAIPFIALALACPFVLAQQTGVAIGATPGSAARNFPKPIVVPSPKPTCASLGDGQANGTPSLPDMIFSREGLVCVRHGDGQTEELSSSNVPSGIPSATGAHIAYWLADKHELHIFSIAQHRDSVVDTVPGVDLRGLVWSMKGQTLAYFLNGATPLGIRAIDLDTGRRDTFAGVVGRLIASPDPEYVVMIGASGLERIRIADGRREVLLPAKYADRAVYSRTGALLGIHANTTAKFLASSPEVAFGGVAKSDSEDDAPDCTGGSFYLIVQMAGTRQLLDVPFPKGFDTVLDFEFSPDESAIVVTFGVVGCDYPGEAARVYKVLLPDLSLTPISSADRMSVEAHWSPDGRMVVYSDYTGSNSPLVAIDLKSGKVTRLTNPKENGPDFWLGWR